MCEGGLGRAGEEEGGAGGGPVRCGELWCGDCQIKQDWAEEEQEAGQELPPPPTAWRTPATGCCLSASPA